MAQTPTTPESAQLEVERLRLLRELIIEYADRRYKDRCEAALTEYTRMVASYGFDLACELQVREQEDHE
jgi:hypothetical protein